MTQNPQFTAALLTGLTMRAMVEVTLAGGPTIVYFGLEPIIDNTDAADRVFNFTGGAEQIAITASTATGFTHRIDSTLGESVDFNLPSNSITILTSDPTDTLTVDVALPDIDVTANVATVTLNADIGGTVVGTATTVNVNAGGSIQDGIDVASAGAVVNVDAGTYVENPVISKSLTLLGPNAGSAGNTLRADGSNHSHKWSRRAGDPCYCR